MGPLRFVVMALAVGNCAALFGQKKKKEDEDAGSYKNMAKDAFQASGQAGASLRRPLFVVVVVARRASLYVSFGASARQALGGGRASPTPA